jgi:hypothetical protein
MLLRLSPRPVAGLLCVAEMRAELTHDRVSFEPKNVRGVGSRLPMIHETSKDAGSRSVVLSKSARWSAGFRCRDVLDLRFAMALRMCGQTAINVACVCVCVLPTTDTLKLTLNGALAASHPWKRLRPIWAATSSTKLQVAATSFARHALRLSADTDQEIPRAASKLAGPPAHT